MYPLHLNYALQNNYYIYENYHFHHSACIEIDVNDVIIIWVLPQNSPVKSELFIVIVLHGSVVV